MKLWRDHRVRELKAELRKAGCRVSGRKAELVARICDHVGNFTVFPKLPIELRELIWEHMLPDGRLVELNRMTAAGMQFDCLTDLNILLHICRESRHFIVRRYSRSIPEVTYIEPNVKGSHFLFDAQSDAIFFNTFIHSGRDTRKIKHDFASVQHVAFHRSLQKSYFGPSVTGNSQRYMITCVLANFQNLREIWFIDAQTQFVRSALRDKPRDSEALEVGYPHCFKDHLAKFRPQNPDLAYLDAVKFRWS